MKIRTLTNTTLLLISSISVLGVSVSYAEDETVTVPYSIKGLENDDIKGALTGELQFTEDKSSQEITITVNDEKVFQKSKNFTVELGQSPQGVRPGDKSTASGTIKYNTKPTENIDPKEYTITTQPTEQTVTEGSGQAFTLPVTISKPAPVGGLTLFYRLLGTGELSEGDIVGGFKGSFTIPAGKQSTVLEIQVYDDRYFDAGAPLSSSSEQEVISAVLIGFTEVTDTPSAGSVAPTEWTIIDNDSRADFSVNPESLTLKESGDNGATDFEYTISFDNVAAFEGDNGEEVGFCYSVAIGIYNYKEAHPIDSVTFNGRKETLGGVGTQGVPDFSEEKCFSPGQQKRSDKIIVSLKNDNVYTLDHTFDGKVAISYPFTDHFIQKEINIGGSFEEDETPQIFIGEPTVKSLKEGSGTEKSETEFFFPLLTNQFDPYFDDKFNLKYTLSGTGIDKDDFVDGKVSGSQLIDPEYISNDITYETENLIVKVKHDKEFEEDETFTITLLDEGLPKGLSLGEKKSATATIINDDKKPIVATLSLNPSFSEELPENYKTGKISFMLTLSQPIDGDMSFNYKISGEGIEVSDITGVDTLEGQVKLSKQDFSDFDDVIEAREALIIWPKDDDVIENDETFTVELTAVSEGITLGDSIKASATILNDDNAEHCNRTIVAGNEFICTECESGAFLADNGVCYQEREVVSIIANDTSKKEGGEDEKTPFSFTATLSEAYPAGTGFDVTFCYGINNPIIDVSDLTADKKDFTDDNKGGGLENIVSGCSGNVTIPAGQKSVDFDVFVSGDNDVEPDETFSVVFANSKGSQYIDTPADAPITNDRLVAISTIENDDVAISIKPLEIGEIAEEKLVTDVGVPLFSVSLGVTVPEDIIIPYTVTGEGITQDDFVSSLTGKFTISANKKEATFALEINNDANWEENETFTVTLTQPDDYSLTDDSELTVKGTIRSEDYKSILYLETETNSKEINENANGDGSRHEIIVVQNVNILLGDKKTETPTVEYEVKGYGDNPATADDFVDEAFPKGTLQFGGTYENGSAKIEINIKGDKEVEADKQFIVTLKNPLLATIEQGKESYIGTILNDDACKTGYKGATCNEVIETIKGTIEAKPKEIDSEGKTTITTKDWKSASGNLSYNWEASCGEGLGGGSFADVNEIDACDPNPCQNGGTCADTSGSFICECTVGYSGSTCDIDESIATTISQVNNEPKSVSPISKTWTAPKNTTGEARTCTIKVTGTDSSNQSSAKATTTFKLTVKEKNNPPEPNPDITLEDKEVTVGEFSIIVGRYAYSNLFIDKDGDSISIVDIEGLPEGSGHNIDWGIDVKPKEAGVYTVKIIGKDSKGATGERTFKLTVKVNTTPTTGSSIIVTPSEVESGGKVKIDAKGYVSEKLKQLADDGVEYSFAIYPLCEINGELKRLDINISRGNLTTKNIKEGVFDGVETLIGEWTTPKDINNVWKCGVEIEVNNNTTLGVLGKFQEKNLFTIKPGEKVADSKPLTITFAPVDVESQEGQAGTTEYLFTLLAFEGTPDPENYTLPRDVTVKYTVTGSGSNLADAKDFVGGKWPKGEVEFKQGQSAKGEIIIRVQGDTEPEPNEEFTVTLQATDGTAIGNATVTGTIKDDDGGASSFASTGTGNQLQPCPTGKFRVSVNGPCFAKQTGSTGTQLIDSRTTFGFEGTNNFGLTNFNNIEQNAQTFNPALSTSTTTTGGGFPGGGFPGGGGPGGGGPGGGGPGGGGPGGGGAATALTVTTPPPIVDADGAATVPEIRIDALDNLSAVAGGGFGATVVFIYNGGPGVANIVPNAGVFTDFSAGGPFLSDGSNDLIFQRDADGVFFKITIDITITGTDDSTINALSGFNCGTNMANCP